MSDESLDNFNREEKLNEAFNRLSKSELPSRDLWLGIEKKLTSRVTKSYTPKWIPWAFAATLLLSFSAVYLSWFNLENAHKVIAENNIQTQFKLNLDIQSQMKAMEKDYGLAKSALISQIRLNSVNLDPAILNEVRVNLIIIEQATSELKAAMLKQPDNPSLPNLLNTTYQQELVVLSQLAKINFES